MSSNRRDFTMGPGFEESPKVTRGRCVAAFCFTWKIISCIVSHVTLVLLVVSYCVGGAYLFQHLEKPHEIEVKKGIHYMRLNLTEKIWRLSDNVSVLNENDWTSDVKKDLANFEKQILTAMKTDGWDGDEDITKTQWTFAGSLFYSIIVITTIGYGHISPRTDWGKVTTIFYAIVGIPLMLLCLSNIGDVMATSFRFIYWRVCCYICTRSSHRGRHRRRSQRALKMHRYSSRSQPPISRRSINVPSRGTKLSSGALYGLTQAYSDPELQRLERNSDPFPADSKTTDDRHRIPPEFYQSPRDIVLQHMRPSNKSHTIDGRSHVRLNPYNTQDIWNQSIPLGYVTVNRNSRFTRQQRIHGGLHDRHTVERERYLSRSKHFNSVEDLNENPRNIKRSLSVRSIRKDPSLEPKQRSTHHKRQFERGLSLPNPRQLCVRAKSIDHRTPVAYYKTFNEYIGNISVIANRYAVKDLEYKERRSKKARSNSTPTALQNNNIKSNSDQNDCCGTQRMRSLQTSHYRPEQSQYVHEEKRKSIHHGNTPFNNTSNNQHHHHHHHQKFQRTCHMPSSSSHQPSARQEMNEMYSNKQVNYNSSTTERVWTDRSEPLSPPSPRIMPPTGFTVKRQAYSRSNYIHDDTDSQYDDGEWSDSYGEISPKDRPVPIWLCVFLVIGYILGGAALFAYWEEWSFLDSAYFCFITLTTIGFGDFVPAKGVKDESEQSIAYCSLYLLFGIALLAMSFNLVQEEFIANVKEVARRLGILKDEDEDDDD